MQSYPVHDLCNETWRQIKKGRVFLDTLGYIAPMSYESRLYEIRSDTFAGLLTSKAPIRIKEIDRTRERGEEAGTAAAAER